MSIFGGAFNPTNFIAQAALATMTGGTSLLVSQIVQQVVSQIAQQLIQQMGQQMGLPQSMIDMAQGTVAGQLGDVNGMTSNFQEAGQNAVGEALGGSFALPFFPTATATQQGQVAQGETQMRDSMQNFIDQMAQNTGGASDEDGNSTSGGGRAATSGGGSWLMAIARALANQVQAAADQLEEKMNNTNWEEAGEVAEFQAQSQQFALIMNTATNAIKTIGESLSTMARKG
jgi:hypothetical protein